MALTPGVVPVTKTGGATPTVQNGDIINTKGVSVTISVPLTVTSIAGGYYPYVKASEVQTSGTNGSGVVQNTWTNLVLNTKDNDTASIASLASNKVTLPAGKYLVKASAPNSSGQPIQVRIYNNTNSTALVLGQNGAAVSGNVNLINFVQGFFVLAAPSDISIQYYCLGASGTLGQALSIGNEVYTVAEFTKVG